MPQKMFHIELKSREIDLDLKKRKPITEDTKASFAATGNAVASDVMDMLADILGRERLVKRAPHPIGAAGIRPIQQ